MEANLGFNKTAKGNDGKLVKLKKKEKSSFILIIINKREQEFKVNLE